MDDQNNNPQPQTPPAGQDGQAESAEPEAVENQNSSSLEQTATTPLPGSSAPASAQPEASVAPTSTGPTTSGGSKKVLLVEDDNNLAGVYTTRLEAEGFDVKRVPNGEDALAAAIEYKPDLILLDVMMPKVSGFDVLDILRNTPETANVKIVMLTALGQDADQQRAKDLGVDDYLVKSQVVIADVVEKIKFHLGM